ncbi:MAG: ferritin-like domain-containing protein, partial [Polyangiales bacterium]
LTPKEEAELRHSIVAWMLSQFLHGEQGALFASAQVTEAVQFFDGKLYGSTQVVDEGRHVEVFHRYLDTKMNKLYQINDNLFVIIDALMADSRWDMKFLGMQIMVEGLALGAFGTLYRLTNEPLLKELLKMVIQDEARHVHYGVLALKEHVTEHLTEAERREREDWTFEVALLMRNRFLAYEVYEEWFEGILTRAQWRHLIQTAPGMEEFRRVMFSRLVPNLREIGLLSDRILPHYRRVGLDRWMGGAAAPELSGEQMIADLDAAAA